MEDHFIRPLAKRGFATEGVDINVESLSPELTVMKDGVYWHPLTSPAATDLLVTRQILPLAEAVDCLQRQLGAIIEEGGGALKAFT